MNSPSDDQGAGLQRAPYPLSVQAQLQGCAVAVEATAHVRSSYAVIWQTLTDYDHLASFIPGIRESAVVERRGCAAIVRQRGYASFLFLSVPLDVVVESLERPPSAISIRVLQGNLKRLDGGYHLREIPGAEDEYVLGWSGLIEPAVPLPMMFAVPFLKAHIEDQFAGMVKEIGRRQAASDLRASADCSGAAAAVQLRPALSVAA